MGRLAWRGSSNTGGTKTGARFTQGGIGGEEMTRRGREG